MSGIDVLMSARRAGKSYLADMRVLLTSGWGIKPNSPLLAIVDEYNDLMKKETGMNHESEAMKATAQRQDAIIVKKPQYLVGKYCGLLGFQNEYFIVEQSDGGMRVAMVSMQDGHIYREWPVTHITDVHVDDARADRLIDAELDHQERGAVPGFSARALTMMCIAISQRRVHELRASNGMSVTQVSNSAKAIMELTQEADANKRSIRILAESVVTHSKTIVEQRGVITSTVKKLATAEQDRDDALKENAKVMAERDEARQAVDMLESAIYAQRKAIERLGKERDDAKMSLNSLFKQRPGPLMFVPLVPDVITTIKIRNGEVDSITKSNS